MRGGMRWLRCAWQHHCFWRTCAACGRGAPDAACARAFRRWRVARRSGVTARRAKRQRTQGRRVRAELATLAWLLLACLFSALSGSLSRGRSRAVCDIVALSFSAFSCQRARVGFRRNGKWRALFLYLLCLLAFLAILRGMRTPVYERASSFACVLRLALARFPFLLRGSSFQLPRLTAAFLIAAAPYRRRNVAQHGVGCAEHYRVSRWRVGCLPRTAAAISPAQGSFRGRLCVHATTFASISRWSDLCCRAN